MGADVSRKKSRIFLGLLLGLLPLLFVVDSITYVPIPGHSMHVGTCAGRAMWLASTLPSGLVTYAGCMRESIGTLPGLMGGRLQADGFDRRCAFVGRWYSWRNYKVYVIAMEADGRFEAYPLDKMGPRASGHWEYGNGYLHWRYGADADSVTERNRVVSPRSNGFSLIELNGERSLFMRYESFEGSCKKD
ncbi:MAG: hypothetical protein REI12_07250 [Pedobacter sp.]|nr:hypothetical protein [Pedobacter sp.]